MPTLGGRIDVGAGAKVLGAVKIGDHALVGANSVVLNNVKPSTTAVGVSARMVSRRIDSESGSRLLEW